MSFLLHVNILDAFIGSNNGKHIFTFCTLKKRLRMPLITGQLLILLYCSTWISLYMNWTLVLSKTSLCSCLVFTCPAWILLSFMYCTLVLSKTSICSCLVLAFPAWILLSFMNCLLVNPNPINLLKCILRFVLNFNTASSLQQESSSHLQE